MRKITKMLCVVLLMFLSVGNVSVMEIKAAEDEKTTDVSKGNGDLLDEIQKRGELIIGTSPDYPPNEFIDPTKTGDDKYVGSDIELAKYIAERLGVKLKIVASDFDTVIANVTMKKVDLGISAFGYTKERENAMELSQGYYIEEGDESKSGLLFRAKDKEKYKELKDFDGMRIAVQNGSLQELYVRKQIPNAQITPIAQASDGVVLLQNNNVDALATAYVPGAKLADNYTELFMSEVLFDTTSSDSGVRIGIPKGETRLLAEVNKILEDVKSQGMYTKWYDDAKSFNENLNEDKTFIGRVTGIVRDSGKDLLIGLMETLKLAGITVVMGTLLGALLAFLKLIKNPIVKFLCSAYVEFIRGTPLLLQLYFFIFLLPMVTGVDVSTYVSVVVALIINSSAYVAEIIRAGIQGVDKGQMEAAKSLGMSNRNAMIRIIVPQATKNILPALGNEFIMMVKETSLASVFFLGDLMTVNRTITSSKYLTIEPLLVVGVIYFIVTFTLSKAVAYMERRMSISD